MKIKDIIVEDQVGKLPPRLQNPTVGLIKFRDGQHADRVYELNRVMMAVAAADGVNPITPSIDSESWAGRSDIATPFTKQEHAMLLQALDAVGSSFEDLNNGDLRSSEMDGTNIKSPIAKPKKNKYGV
jgi:hypothetical protein